MLAENNAAQLRDFCYTLHPARTAEFIEGLTETEIWELLRHCDLAQRVEIFSFLPLDKQLAILQTAPRDEIGRLVTELPPDDRVDILQDLDKKVGDEIIALLPLEERRDISRLRAYPEGTCGSVMTTDFIRLDEKMTVNQAIHEVSHQMHIMETVYYLYVLDEWGHLVGLVSAKQLLAAVDKGNTPIGDIMRRDLITVKTFDDSRKAAHDIARYDFIAVPVVDEEYRMLGIITYDDVIDINREQETKRVYQMAAVAPMEEAYLEAPFFTIWRKRVIWLACLFIAELFTFTALSFFEQEISQLVVLAMFVPLCISTGGNSGAQAATLITRSLALGEVTLRDWARVLRHELLMGVALGLSIGVIGFCRAAATPQSVIGMADRWLLAITIGQAVAMICLCGTIVGSLLPLLFKRINIDPAVASSPFVATFVDVSGIIIYFTIAQFWLLSSPPPLAPMVSLPAVSIELSLDEPTLENRRAVSEMCYQQLSRAPGCRYFYTTESLPEPHENDSPLVKPADPKSRYQVGCVLVFKHKKAYNDFMASDSLSHFMAPQGDHWRDRRVILFQVEAAPDNEKY